MCLENVHRKCTQTYTNIFCVQQSLVIHNFMQFDKKKKKKKKKHLRIVYQCM